MKIRKVLFGLVLIGLIAGFIWLATTDIPVEQRPVSITIENERFYNAE